MPDSFICVTWLIHKCDMTHSYVWHDSFLCVSLGPLCLQVRGGWGLWMPDSFICVTWLIHKYDVTHSYVWHDSFHMWDVTDSCVWHDSSNTDDSTLTCFTSILSVCVCVCVCVCRIIRKDTFWVTSHVTWLIRMCDMTHIWHMGMSHVKHVNNFLTSHVTHVNESCHTFTSILSRLECVTWFVYLCDMTNFHVWHDSFLCGTWLIYIWDMTHSYIWCEWFIFVTWLLQHR